MRKIKYFISLVTLSAFFSFQLIAQHSSNSPFTRYGIGEINNYLSPHNLAMGGVFNTDRSRAHVNIANPASYTASPNQSFLLEFSFQNKNSFFAEGNSKASVSDGNLSFMAAQFPVTKWWSASFGLTPYSSLGYKISHKEGITGSQDTASYSYIGNGGINTVFIGNAFEIAKKLSIGVNANFLYGSNEQISSVSFLYSDFQSSTVSKLTTRFHQFNYRVGLQYYDSIKGDYHFSIGAAFENKTNLKAFTEEQILNYYLINNLQFSDTLKNTTSGSKIIELPQFLSGGIMLAKGNNIKLRADYYTRNWSNALFLSKPNSSYNNEYGYSVGTEYIPDMGAPQFWRNIRFNLGAYYKQTNIKIDNNPLMDYGLGFGFGFPIKASNTIVNTVFTIGKKTTNVAGMLDETYANIYINISLGDIWFVRRKFN